MTSPFENASWAALEEMLANAEEFYQALGLPYQASSPRSSSFFACTKLLFCPPLFFARSLSAISLHECALAQFIRLYCPRSQPSRMWMAQCPFCAPLTASSLLVAPSQQGPACMRLRAHARACVRVRVRALFCDTKGEGAP